jgi:hypothetical protein
MGEGGAGFLLPGEQIADGVHSICLKLLGFEFGFIGYHLDSLFFVCFVCY